jgi:hypothetical protein
MFALGDAARQQDNQLRGLVLLPRDSTPAELAAVPSLASVDTLLISDLTDVGDPRPARWATAQTRPTMPTPGLLTVLLSAVGAASALAS